MTPRRLKKSDNEPWYEHGAIKYFLLPIVMGIGTTVLGLAVYDLVNSLKGFDISYRDEPLKVEINDHDQNPNMKLTFYVDCLNKSNETRTVCIVYNETIYYSPNWSSDLTKDVRGSFSKDSGIKDQFGGYISLPPHFPITGEVTYTFWTPHISNRGLFTHEVSILSNPVTFLASVVWNGKPYATVTKAFDIKSAILKEYSKKYPE